MQRSVSSVSITSFWQWRTCGFYRKVLGMKPIEHQTGALEFGSSKISLQLAGAVPEIARNTTAGSANFAG